MEKKTIKLVVIVLLTGLVFTLTACDSSTKWGTGIANHYKSTKFAPDLHEVLPESAASLIFEGGSGAGYSLPRAFAGTETGIERMFSPDSSWLTRSPDSLLAGYNFARNGEDVVKRFEFLGGEDGEISSGINYAVWPLSSGLVDKTNVWMSQSSSDYAVRGFYSDTNGTLTVHSEEIIGRQGYGRVYRTMRSTAIIHPDGTTELFYDDRDSPNSRLTTSYSTMKGENFVYYHNDRFRHHQNEGEYHDRFFYMEFSEDQQGIKTGTYILVEDNRVMTSNTVDNSWIRYVHFEGDDNDMFMYHGEEASFKLDGIFQRTDTRFGLTLIQNGISVSFINDSLSGGKTQVNMDIPALSGISTVYYTGDEYYNWVGQGIDAGGNLYIAGADMWPNLESRFVLKGGTRVRSLTEIMGSISLRFPETSDPLGEFKTILGDMGDIGITVNDTSLFQDYQTKYDKVNDFVDSLRIGDIDIPLNMDNFAAIRTAVTAFFDTYGAVF